MFEQQMLYALRNVKRRRLNSTLGREEIGVF